MAWQVLRPGRKGVYIKYFDINTYSEQWIPRKLIKHLDGKPADEVTAWIETWEAKHGKARDRSERIHLKEDDRLASLWKQYQGHRNATRKRRGSTADTETSIFERHIVPFFVGIHKRKNPARWHDLVPEFHTYLYQKNYADRTIQKTLWTLERFGRYLVFLRHMTFAFAVDVPARANQKVTPLKTRKAPDEVLKFVKTATYDYTAIDFNLMTLLGYFAALRPSELFALERSDLLTGSSAEKFSKTLEGFREIDLGTKLAVSISKTIESGLPTRELTKTDASCAVVNIWHPEAAKRIAEIVRDRPPGRLFPYSYDWLMRAWFVHVQPTLETTIHDLRRASGLYLGRTTRIPVTLLQEHMRHANIETTMLYMREPDVPEKNARGRQNFDDILD